MRMFNLMHVVKSGRGASRQSYLDVKRLTQPVNEEIGGMFMAAIHGGIPKELPFFNL